MRRTLVVLALVVLGVGCSRTPPPKKEVENYTTQVTRTGGNGPPTGPRTKYDPPPVTYKPPINEVPKASTGVKKGNVQVRAVSIEIRKPQLKTKFETNEPSLYINLRVKNIANGGNLININPWGSDDRVKLTDSTGQSYTRYQPPDGEPRWDGQIENRPIPPDDATNDVLYFAHPNPKAEWFRLELPLGNVGGEGNIVLQIDRSMIGQTFPVIDNN